MSECLVELWGAEKYSRWAEYVEGHEEATIHHHPDWLRTMGASFPYRLHLAVALRGGEVVGGVPAFEVRSPWARRLVAVPFRDRGGLLWSDAQAFYKLVKALWAPLLLKSLRPYPPDLWTAAGLNETFHWVNSRVDLSQLTDAGLLQRLGPKVRNKLRQGERAGLTWEEGGSLEEFYDLYLRTQRHLGVPPFPKKFFLAQRQHLGPAWKLFTVRQEGRALAATIVLLWRKEAIYAYSCSDPEVRDLRPNDFLLTGVLRWLLARGFAIFDMGSDSPTQEGLLLFKRKWLATQTVCPVYALGKAPIQDSSASHFRIARSLLGRMPLWLLQLTSYWTHWFG